MKNISTNASLFLFVGLFYLLWITPNYADIDKNTDKWRYHQKTQIKWREYSGAAFLEAKEKNKPLFVFIYSDLCGWCRKFETESLEKPSIKSILSKKFVPVAIDQQTQPELAKQLGVSLVPASLLITPDKQKLLRLYGYLSEKELSDVLSKSLSSWRKGEIPEEEFGDESTCCPIPDGEP